MIMSERSRDVFDWMHNPKVAESDLFRDYKMVTAERDKLLDLVQRLYDYAPPVYYSSAEHTQAMSDAAEALKAAREENHD